MFRRTISLVAVAALVLALGPTAQAALYGPAGLPCPTGPHPTLGRDWQVEDLYQMVFTTNYSGTTQIEGHTGMPKDTNIDTYNNVVRWEAELAGVGATAGITWYAIVSTPDVDARNNAQVTGPIYNMRLGIAQGGVAASFLASGPGTFWDGDLDHAVSYCLGAAGVGTGWRACNNILTGSNTDGTENGGHAAGNDNPAYGFPDTDPENDPLGSDWIAKGTSGDYDGFRLYGMSMPLEVMPEPATMGLLVLGGLGMLIGRRRQRA